MTVHVFHGPSVTAREVAEISDDFCSHPPVRHGDLLALDYRAGDVVLLIDGVFHTVPPVRHKEILWLLAQGVTVAGAASMGALRAAELHPYGMHGIGRVFEMYRSGVIDADDEVGVAHTPDGHPLSVALVDVRAKLDEAVQAGALSTSESDSLLRLARSIHYMQRSRGALRKAAEEETCLSASARAWWTGPDGPLSESAGLKHADALTALTAVAEGRLAPSDTRALAEAAWFTPRLHHWVWRFRPRSPEIGPVPFTAELQHQQLYDPGFANRWRRFVLAWIADEHCADDDSTGHQRHVESRAIEAARARGVTLETLRPHQLGYWLTPTETAMPEADEQMLRLLVRSIRLGGADDPRLTNQAHAAYLLNPQIDSTGAVKAAWNVNAAVTESAPHRSIHRLRPDLLAAHIADHWQVPTDDRPQLEAAARDRAFFDADEAIDAARTFYLHASGTIDKRSVN
ncbi:TfuA-like protein [Streptomyces sp. HNM1019]|uniref:TfuA-like protein n=1 Tax=Streptomyces sp. HNM1019 TaxID=3424717 RepID=UPI003D786B6A